MGHALVVEALALTVEGHSSLCVHGHPKRKGKERSKYKQLQAHCTIFFVTQKLVCSSKKNTVCSRLELCCQENAVENIHRENQAS